jgi:LmbE family N-acetylglucosaminyl deacetylase
VIGQIVSHLRRVQPDVVITFDPFGVYGHPDHIAICQFTTAAVMRAADASYQDHYEPHQVAKLYYMVATKARLATYQKAFGSLAMRIDGDERRAEGWLDWAITTHINTLDYWEQVWEAVSCHQTQLPGYAALKDLPAEKQRSLWQEEQYYRVFSLVNGGRTPEKDLFIGIDNA